MSFPPIPAGYPALFERFRVLYQEMVQEIGESQPRAINLLEGYQLVFDCSVNYRLQLSELTGPGAFQNWEQEVFYFREIKPLFVAHTLFASFCYHVEMFRGDSTCPHEELTLLNRQLQRLARFESRNAEFLQFVHTAGPLWDRAWFTRAGGRGRVSGQVTEETRGEGLLAEYYANQLFHNFILGKIRQLAVGGSGAA